MKVRSPKSSTIDHLRSVIFDTTFSPVNPRYLWYGPVGHIKIDGSKWWVQQSQDDPWEEPTDQQRKLFKDLYEKL